MRALCCLCALALLILPAFAQRAQDSALAAAQSLFDHGQLDEALKATTALAQQHPEPAGVERLRGKILYLKMNIEEADKAFLAAIHSDPNDKESLELHGISLLKMGKASAALPLLEQSHANLSSLNVDGAYVLALCLLKERRYDEARAAFTAFYGLDAESSSSYLLMARMLLREQNTATAQEMARKALTINPKLPEAHMLLGQIDLSVGNLDSALSEFQHETEVNPMFGPAYDRLGDVLLQKNQFEKAQEALNRAILLEPDMTGPYILLGQVLLKRNNPATASIYLKRAVQMDPGNQMSHYFLGQAYRTMGKKQEAMAEFDAVSKIKAMPGH